MKPSLLALALTGALALQPALAAPGAHGPNGEHLDAPASQAATSALPRLEAKTEAFELVATLQATELSVLIDRYATNEPVLGATLEVEAGGIKARATFHADLGDYAFDDAKLLALLRTPGEHALVFTLVAGAETDLLDGTLVTTAAGAAAAADHSHAHDDHGHDDHGHDHTLEYAAWSVGGVLLLAGAYVWRRRRAGKAVAPKGAL
ncbi:hypothetical protein [Piscinibacter koreensis]|uniref:Uncharacterized protein n=1 Tax=Piscinibacter koreensis TaxID=2742824 RepID=A0A7Y6TZ67_9BURK|nr:hypothetical protein [Schlegelella koreensis]NUZ09019.1 hypothetical protein [Schlegelella koreensis]